MKKRVAVILACMILSASSLSGCQAQSAEQTVPTQASTVESTESAQSVSDTGVRSENSDVDDSASAVSETSEKSVPDAESSQPQPSAQESSKQESKQTSEQSSKQSSETSKQESSQQTSETSKQESSKPSEESSHQQSSESSKQESSKQSEESSHQETSKPTPVVVTITNMTLDKSSMTLTAGGSQELNAYVYFSDGSRTYQGISWQSSNSSVATVSSSGVVTAKSAGSATITASYTYKNKTYTQTCSVKVNAVSVSSIAVSSSSATLNYGDTKTLSVTAYYNNNTSKTVSGATWKSSNTNVATVNSSGVVTAKNAGTATITATYGGKSSTCTITVKAKEVVADAVVQRIALSQSSITLDSGNTYTFTVTVYMSDGSTKKLSNSSISWSTIDEGTIAKVSSDGVVTGVQGGETVLHASYKANGTWYTASCTVKVNSAQSSSSNTGAELNIWTEYSKLYKVYSQGGYEMAEIPGIADAINKYRRELGLKDVEWMGPDWSEEGMQKVVQEFNSKDEETKQMIRESFPECFPNGEIDPVKYSWKRKCSRVCNSMEYCIVNHTISHGNDYDGVQSNCNGQHSGYNLERWVSEYSYSAGHWNKLMSKSARYVYAVMSPPTDGGSCKICIYIF